MTNLATQRRIVAGSAAKALIRSGWKCIISVQLELALFDGQESSTIFFAIPSSQVIEAVILFPSYSQLTDTDINSSVAFKMKDIRAFLGLTDSP